MKTPITIKELIQILSQCTPELPVYTTWEGQVIPLTRGCVTVEPVHGKFPERLEIYAEDL